MDSRRVSPQPQSRLEQEKAYRNFILDLYQARPISGHVWLHGARAGRMVHVGAVDAPVTAWAISRLSFRSSGRRSARTGLDSSGTALMSSGGTSPSSSMRRPGNSRLPSNKIDLKFKKIPHEVLEKKAVEQGDIKFFEMASLSVKLKKSKKSNSR